MIAATCVDASLQVVVHDLVIEQSACRARASASSSRRAIFSSDLGPAAAQSPASSSMAGGFSRIKDGVGHALAHLAGTLDVDLQG